MGIPDINDVIKNSRAYSPQSLKKFYPEFYEFLIKKYPEVTDNKERLYLYYNNLDNYKTCPICGKRLSFVSFRVGYKKYCSIKCAHKDPEFVENRKKLMLEKYGVEHSSQIPEVKERVRQTCIKKYGGIGFGSIKTREKIKQTNIERYGSETPSSTNKIKEKIKQTNIERYGGVGLQSKELKEKIQKTNLERYGGITPMASEEIREKLAETNLEKYGSVSPFGNNFVRNKSRHTKNERYGDPEYSNGEKMKKTSIERYGGVGLQSEELKEKAQKTNLEKYGAVSPLGNIDIQNKNKEIWNEKYGVNNPFESEEIKEKIKQTNIERYGCENPFESEEIKEKIKQINIERYGGENPMSSYEVREKIKHTNIERYGAECVFALPEIKEKIKQTNIERYGVEHPSQLDNIKERVKETSLKKYNKEYYTQTDEYLKRCNETKKKNNSFNTSKIEQDFKQWLIDNNIEFDYQHHDDKYPFDCDFYFPKSDTYLEIQGHWTHGSKPFNSDEDKEVLNKWMEKSKKSKFFERAIKVWVENDPQKRQWAKEHKLNWHEVFTNDLNILINECHSLNIF